MIGGTLHRRHNAYAWHTHLHFWAHAAQVCPRRTGGVHALVSILHMVVLAPLGPYQELGMFLQARGLGTVLQAHDILEPHIPRSHLHHYSKMSQKIHRSLLHCLELHEKLG